jgi:predicted acyl esterase
MRADLAARSVGCFAERMTLPTLWVQAFDDGLFPAEMAISMWRRMPHRSQNRLYLSMGGHAAPTAQQAVQDLILADQFAFLDQHVLGRRASIPPVTYWTRDPAVAVAPDSYRYPLRAWYLQTAGGWPPAGTVDTVYGLGFDGRMVRSGASAGTLPLAPADQDARNDPVVLAGTSGTPLGTTAATLPRVEAPGFVAGFRTDPLAKPQELSGSPVARLAWTPAGADSQLVLKVLDQAPDGRLTLLTRGVQGMRGAQPGARQEVRVEASAFSALIPTGHRVVAWVTAGDSSFYKAYPGMAGGALEAGAASTLTLPLRDARVPAGGPVKARIRLSARPGRVSVGRRTRFRFRATTRWGGRRIAVSGATVRFAGRRARTNRRGRVTIVVRLGHRGRRRARATKRGMRSGTAIVRALRRRAQARRAPHFTG